MTKRLRPDQFPPWYDGQSINEAAFCREFLASHKLLYTENSFFTPEGRMTDEAPLKTEIYQIIEPYASTSVPKKISNIIELLKITAHIDDFPPRTDRIHVANGTLFLDGSFSTTKDRIVRSRFPVVYNPSVPSPETWLGFLHGLLYEDDIPTLQEYIGYCLIPSNKGQRMMVIKGSGGEGKSQIGTVLSHLFGCNAKDGSVGKVSENRFARADLEHIHLLIDDDMRMEALRQTNYVKSLVTAQGRMDLEKKGRQSYQGWMFARLLAFSNGDLQSLYDRSNGFYRRQLILTTREPRQIAWMTPTSRKRCAASWKASSSGPLRVCSVWWRIISASPKAPAPMLTGKRSSRMRTTYFFSWMPETTSGSRPKGRLARRSSTKSTPSGAVRTASRRSRTGAFRNS